ncbi:MAG TPA: hypothetical protein VKF38_02500, partial [Anaerolineaceae bacterium]|nr:hypothetical protein [Anaerolineaceae bacterium]
MIKRSLVALIFLTLCLAACAPAAATPQSTIAKEVAPASPPIPQAPAAAGQISGSAPAQNLSIGGNSPALLPAGQTTDTTNAADRIVIKTASLSII